MASRATRQSNRKNVNPYNIPNKKKIKDFFQATPDQAQDDENTKGSTGMSPTQEIGDACSQSLTNTHNGDNQDTNSQIPNQDVCKSDGSDSITGEDIHDQAEEQQEKVTTPLQNSSRDMIPSDPEDTQAKETYNTDALQFGEGEDNEHIKPSGTVSRKVSEETVSSLDSVFECKDCKMKDVTIAEKTDAIMNYMDHNVDINTQLNIKIREASTLRCEVGSLKREMINLKDDSQTMTKEVSNQMTINNMQMGTIRQFENIHKEQITTIRKLEEDNLSIQKEKDILQEELACERKKYNNYDEMYKEKCEAYDDISKDNLNMQTQLNDNVNDLADHKVLLDQKDSEIKAIQRELAIKDSKLKIANIDLRANTCKLVACEGELGKVKCENKELELTRDKLVKELNVKAEMRNDSMSPSCNFNSGQNQCRSMSEQMNSHLVSKPCNSHSVMNVNNTPSAMPNVSHCLGHADNIDFSASQSHVIVKDSEILQPFQCNQAKSHQIMSVCNKHAIANCSLCSLDLGSAMKSVGYVNHSSYSPPITAHASTTQNNQACTDHKIDNCYICKVSTQGIVNQENSNTGYTGNTTPMVRQSRHQPADNVGDSSFFKELTFRDSTVKTYREETTKTSTFPARNLLMLGDSNGGVLVNYINAQRSNITVTQHQEFQGMDDLQPVLDRVDTSKYEGVIICIQTHDLRKMNGMINEETVKGVANRLVVAMYNFRRYTGKMVFLIPAPKTMTNAEVNAHMADYYIELDEIKGKDPGVIILDTSLLTGSLGKNNGVNEHDNIHFSNESAVKLSRVLINQVNTVSYHAFLQTSVKRDIIKPLFGKQLKIIASTNNVELRVNSYFPNCTLIILGPGKAVANALNQIKSRLTELRSRKKYRY